MWIIDNRVADGLSWNDSTNSWESDIKVFTDEEKEQTDLPVNGEWVEIGKINNGVIYMISD